MKITIIKKSDTKVKTISVCPWLVDMPPVSQK